MPDLIKVAVLTTGRQDYGVLRSTVKLLSTDKDFELFLLVGGMHLSDRYGRTFRQIEADGLIITRTLNWMGNSDWESSIQEQCAEAIRLVSAALTELKPDFLLLVGDRFETAVAALAAVLCLVPIVHLHGGEETEGAIDNQLRHAITKMSHLHLVSHPIHQARVIQMGESPETVHIVGAPGLDNLFRSDLPAKKELESRLNVELKSPVIIVTLHPVTALVDETQKAVETLLRVMDQWQATYIITLPNADPGNESIRTSFLAWAEEHTNSRAVEALGEQGYFGLMRIADLMVGNSSSGLVEAGAYQLPVVDIGSRQQGRLRGPNVVHAEPEFHSLFHAFETALSLEFKKKLQGTTSPYSEGCCANKIVSILHEWNIHECHIVKKFNEVKCE